MSIGDPRDKFFYPTLTLMIDFYILHENIVVEYLKQKLNDTVFLYKNKFFLQATISLQTKTGIKYQNVETRRAQWLSGSLSLIGGTVLYP